MPRLEGSRVECVSAQTTRRGRRPVLIGTGHRPPVAGLLGRDVDHAGPPERVEVREFRGHGGQVYGAASCGSTCGNARHPDAGCARLPALVPKGVFVSNVITVTAPTDATDAAPAV